MIFSPLNLFYSSEINNFLSKHQGSSYLSNIIIEFWTKDICVCMKKISLMFIDIDGRTRSAWFLYVTAEKVLLFGKEILDFLHCLLLIVLYRRAELSYARSVKAYFLLFYWFRIPASDSSLVINFLSSSWSYWTDCRSWY